MSDAEGDMFYKGREVSPERVYAKTYVMRVRCGNCGTSYDKTIDFGLESGPVITAEECLNCGVKGKIVRADWQSLP